VVFVERGRLSYPLLRRKRLLHNFYKSSEPVVGLLSTDEIPVFRPDRAAAIRALPEDPHFDIKLLCRVFESPRMK
jgi:hypothetical protein